jgi:hypothetical protein
VVGLVVSTSLLLLVMRARMKGGWVMSADSLMTLLMAWRAWSAIVAWLVTFSPRVIITSLSARGRALGMTVVGVFFFLHSTVVKGFSSWMHSAIPLRWSAQVWLWVPFQSASHSLGIGALLTGGSLVTDGRVTQVFQKEKMRSNNSNNGNYLLLRGILSKLMSSNVL